MPRRPRVVLPGFPHHITQRGNCRDDVFLDDGDRKRFLGMLCKYSKAYVVDTWSYCLMSNHFHLVVRPESSVGLQRCMHDLDGAYAQWFNRKYGRIGHLWQDRFFGCVLDSSHLWNAVRYVERNPVRSGLVARAEEYPWSSAAARCTGRTDPVLSDGNDFPPPGLISNWSDWLETGLTDEDLQLIRRTTKQGVPLGSESFVAQLESLLGVRLRPKKPAVAR